MAARPRRSAAARALGLFWGVVLVACAGGAAVLQVLGPPARRAPPVAATPPPAAAPAWDGRIAGPIPALLEPSRAFPPSMLPRIAADGRTPRKVYARPSPPDTRPRIALVMAGLGLSDADTRTAIARLPGAVTLAFSAYAPNPEPLLDAARASGHEILASLPMEPRAYPLDTAGPHALMTGASAAENSRNLDWVMGRIQGYVGLTGASDGLRGERYAMLTSGFNAALSEIARRGLLYLDPRPPADGRATEPLPGIASSRVDVVVDDPPSRADIEGKLVALERLARERGTSVGLAGPIRPVTVERIAAWARDVEGRGFVLVPVSAVAAAAEPAQ